MYYKDIEAVVRVGKELVRTGLVTATWGNISCRLPNNKGFLVTPSGIDYEKIDGKDLVTLDEAGNVMSGNKKPTSELLMHIAIYKARPDVNSVVHTHSHYASAFAVARRAIPSIVEDIAMLAGGSIEVAPYAFPGTQELADNVVKTLGRKNGVLLANHGVVGVGKDITEALRICQLIEKTALIYLSAMNLGEPHILSDAEIELLKDKYHNNYGQGRISVGKVNN